MGEHEDLQSKSAGTDMGGVPDVRAGQLPSVANIHRVARHDVPRVTAWQLAAEALLDGNPTDAELLWLERGIVNVRLLAPWAAHRFHVVQQRPDADDEQVRSAMKLDVRNLSIWHSIVENGLLVTLRSATAEERPSTLRAMAAIMFAPDNLGALLAAAHSTTPLPAWVTKARPQLTKSGTSAELGAVDTEPVNLNTPLHPNDAAREEGPDQVTAALLTAWQTVCHGILGGEPRPDELAWAERAVLSERHVLPWLHFREHLLHTDPEGELGQFKGLLTMNVKQMPIWTTLIEKGFARTFEDTAAEDRPQLTQAIAAILYRPDLLNEFFVDTISQVPTPAWAAACEA